MSKLHYGLLPTMMVFFIANQSIASDAEQTFDDNLDHYASSVFSKMVPLTKLDILETETTIISGNSRLKENLKFLKVRGDNFGAAMAYSSSDAWVDLVKTIQTIQKTERYNLEAGLPEKAIRWVYTQGDFTWKAAGMKFAAQLIEGAGSVNLITSGLECRTFFWPLATLTLESACKESPIKKIMLTLANNQLPMIVAGRIKFAAQPVIDLEMLNVGKLDLVVDPTLFKSKIPAQVLNPAKVAVKQAVAPPKAPSKAAAKTPSKAPAAPKQAAKAPAASKQATKAPVKAKK